MTYLSYFSLPYPKIYLLPKLDFHNVVLYEKLVGFFTSVNYVLSFGQMRVIVVVIADGAVISIQTFGAICEDILTSEVS